MLNNCSCSPLITASEDEHDTIVSGMITHRKTMKTYIVQIAAGGSAPRAHSPTVGADQVGI